MTDADLRDHLHVVHDAFARLRVDVATARRERDLARAEADALRADVADLEADRDRLRARASALDAELRRLGLPGPLAPDPGDPGRPFTPDETAANLRGRLRDLEDRVARLEAGRRPRRDREGDRLDGLRESLRHINGA